MTRPKSAARTRSSPSRARALGVAVVVRKLPRRRAHRGMSTFRPRAEDASGDASSDLASRCDVLLGLPACVLPSSTSSAAFGSPGAKSRTEAPQMAGSAPARHDATIANSAQRPRFHPLDEDEDVRERGDPRAQRHAAQIHVNHRAKPVVRARPPRRSALPRRQQPAPESHQNLGALSQGISSCVNCHGEGPASTANHRRTVKSQKTPVCLPVRIFATFFAIFGVGPKQTGRRRDCQRGQGGCREVVGRLLGSKEVLQVEVVWCRRFGCHRERRVLRG